MNSTQPAVNRQKSRQLQLLPKEGVGNAAGCRGNHPPRGWARRRHRTLRPLHPRASPSMSLSPGAHPNHYSSCQCHFPDQELENPAVIYTPQAWRSCKNRGFHCNHIASTAAKTPGLGYMFPISSLEQACLVIPGLLRAWSNKTLPKQAVFCCRRGFNGQCYPVVPLLITRLQAAGSSTSLCCFLVVHPLQP